MNKLYLAFALSILIALGVFGYMFSEWFFARESLRRLDVRVERIMISGISPTSIDLEIYFTITNKGDSDVSIDGISYEMFIGNRSIGSGNYSKSESIPPNSEITIRSLLRVGLKTLEQTLIDVILSGNLSSRILVHIYKDTPLGVVRIVREVTYP
ncbi:MAG: LEA type 2 family protein [Sulfolobales archaeon]